jgi:hypothetical protein
LPASRSSAVITLPRSSAAVVPGERLAQAIVHADVEVGHDEDGVCSRSARSKALRAELEALGGSSGKQQHVLGVAVRGIGAAQQVRLLRARRHAGRRAAALHVEDHRREFGEVGEADELLHQRDAGAGGAVKARAPFQAAPITMPIEASSSSACTMA